MNDIDKEQIKSMLTSLTDVAYTALIEAKKSNNKNNDAEEKNLKAHQDNLKMRIEELFTKA